MAKYIDNLQWSKRYCNKNCSLLANFMKGIFKIEGEQNIRTDEESKMKIVEGKKKFSGVSGLPMSFLPNKTKKQVMLA